MKTGGTWSILFQGKQCEVVNQYMAWVVAAAETWSKQNTSRCKEPLSIPAPMTTSVPAQEHMVPTSWEERVEETMIPSTNHTTLMERHSMDTGANNTPPCLSKASLADSHPVAKTLWGSDAQESPAAKETPAALGKHLHDHIDDGS